MIVESSFNMTAFIDSIKRKMTYGMSARSIAPTIGVSHCTLSRILKAETVKPDIVTVLKICDWLGVSIQIFIIMNIKPA